MDRERAKRLALYPIIGIGWVWLALTGAVLVLAGGAMAIGFYYLVGKALGLWG